MGIDWQSIAGDVVKAGAPTIGGILGGPAGGALGGLIGNLLGSALGVPADPQSVSNAIQNDPTAAAKIQAVEDAHKTALDVAAADLQSARSQTVELAKAGSSIAWGAPVVSAIGIVGFVTTSWIVLFHGAPDTASAQGIISTTRDIAIYVVSYWLGSSFGSRAKDDTIAASVASVKRR